MPLTSAQLLALKTDIAANTNTIVTGGQTVQIRFAPATPDANIDIANWYNQNNNPDYYVWKSTLTRSEVYHQTSPDGTTWNWQTYTNQSVPEQGAWTQMFMGDAGPIGNVNFRAGVLAIFSGAGAPTTQRNHVFSAGRRLCTRAEKLFAVAVVNPPANTGNNTGNPRGSATNPDNLTFEGKITANEVDVARS